LVDTNAVGTAVTNHVLANLGAIAREVGAEFFAETQAQAEEPNLESIHWRAETVTNFLMEQMSRTDVYSRRHWAINE
jgi:hypothetical protein